MKRFLRPKKPEVVVRPEDSWSPTRRNKLMKCVKDAIWRDYTYPHWTDPNCKSLQLQRRYIDEDVTESFRDFVYNMRYDLFETAVTDAINNFAKSQDEADFMWRYFDNLTPSDYARNLYLNRPQRYLNNGRTYS